MADFFLMCKWKIVPQIEQGAGRHLDFLRVWPHTLPCKMTAENIPPPWELRAERRTDEPLEQAFFRARGLGSSPAPAREQDVFDAPEFPGVEQLFAAVKNEQAAGRRICIFGDYDADGATAVAILTRALQAVGAQVWPALPTRAQGYGLRPAVFAGVAQRGVRLIITCDTGISNGAQIDEGLKNHGVATIVTDHHSIPPQLPKTALAMLHPALLSGKEADIFAPLTGAGVAFFAALGLLRRAGRFSEEEIRKHLRGMLACAALGTVADIGPLQGLHRGLVAGGLREVRQGAHRGLSALFEAAGRQPQSATDSDFGFFLGPRCNAPGRLHSPSSTLNLLLGDASMAPVLEAANAQRKEKTEELLIFARQQMSAEPPAAITHYNPCGHAGLSGLVAGNLAEAHARPVAVLANAPADPNILVGSMRSTPDYSLAEFLHGAGKHLFINAGGHAAAAGCSLHMEHLEAFKKAFAQDALQKRGAHPAPIKKTADTTASFAEITPELVQAISIAGPFGPANPQPMFASSDAVKAIEIRQMGSRGSVCGRLADASGVALPFVCFARGGRAANIPPRSRILFCTEIYRQTVQLRVEAVG